MWGSENFGSTENHGTGKRCMVRLAGLYIAELWSQIWAQSQWIQTLYELFCLHKRLFWPCSRFAVSLLRLPLINSSGLSLSFTIFRPSSQPLIKISLSPFHFSKESAVPLLLHPITLVKLFIAAYFDYSGWKLYEDICLVWHHIPSTQKVTETHLVIKKYLVN